MGKLYLMGNGNKKPIATWTNPKPPAKSKSKAHATSKTHKKPVKLSAAAKAAAVKAKASVTKAKNLFDKYRGQGYLPMNAKDKEMLVQFDPKVSEIILGQPMRGGC